MIVYRLHRDTRPPCDYNLNKESRWNPPRTPMLYCAATVSLCCLEVLVHTDSDLIPDNLVWSWAELPADPELSRFRWNAGDVKQTRPFGKSWIDSKRSLALEVPSVIVPHTKADFNILLNPLHDDYDKIQWQRGGKFSFDPRLLSDQPAV